MPGSLIDRVHRYHAALNALDLATVESMLADAAEYHSPSVGGILGKPAIVAAMRGYFAEYPDQVAEDQNVEFAGPDAVRSEWRLTATSKSTGKVSTREGLETVYFDPAGLIRRIEVRDKC